MQQQRQQLVLEESSFWRYLKRTLLILPVAALVCSHFVPEDLYYSFPVLSPVSFVSFWIVFWNFPQFGSWINTRPLHVEDLQTCDARKKFFLKCYTHSTNFLLALVMMGLVDYTFAIQKKHRAVHSVVEACGIIGGVLALYLKIQNVLGVVLLHITYRRMQSFRIIEDSKESSHT